MKSKYLLFAMMALVGCTDEAEWAEAPQPVEGLAMTAKDFEWEQQKSRTTMDITTAGAIFSWAENDTVGIFPNEGAQAYFPMSSGAGTKRATFNGGGWALKPSSTYVAYYPYCFDYRIASQIAVNYEGQTQTENGSTAHLGKYDYMVAQAKAPENGLAHFDFEHIGCLIELNLTLPDKGTLDSLTLKSNEELFVQRGTFDLFNPNLQVQKKTSDFTIHCKEVKTQTDSAEVKLYFMLAPTAAQGKTVDLQFTNNGVKYLGTVQLKNFEAGKAYSLSANVKGQSNVFHVEKSGTLPSVMSGINPYTITHLKVSGELNSVDVKFIRKMAGVAAGYDIHTGECTTPGILSHLDLSEARFVWGGGTYWDDISDGDDPDEHYSTRQDIVSESMFSGCRHLEELLLPYHLTECMEYAFSGCENLRTLKIPYTVERIGYRAFAECKKLASIDLPSQLPYIADEVFYHCVSLTSIVIPEGVKWIGNQAFYYCINLEMVKLPQQLERIGEEAFSQNRKLSSLILPEHVAEIGYQAFGYCTNLTHVCSLSSIPPKILPNPYWGDYNIGFEKNCNIYVPAYAVGDYKLARGWDAYADNILTRLRRS